MHADGPLRMPVVITNPQGLHMRPAMAFAKEAMRFRSVVTIWAGERRINGKSLLEIMMLAAEPGAQLVVEVSGDDATHALPTLAEILAAECCDDESADE